MKTEFKEEQKFTQIWLWIILILIAFLPVIGIYKQLILGEKFGNQPMSDLGLIFFSLFVFMLIILFFSMKLKTEINQTEIKINFYPFLKRSYNWKEIKKAEIVNYGFVGGWGIRFWPKYGTIYNVKGNKGLAIEFFNGKKILIGTQKEIEINKIVKKASGQHWL